MDYLREFLAEAEELIEALYGDVRTLSANVGDGRVRRQMIGSIFRHVHTIKGGAAAAGLDATARIAHEFETLLDAARTGRASIGDDTLEVFTDATNALAHSLSATNDNAPDALIERLRELANGESDGREGDAAKTKTSGVVSDASSIVESLPADIARSLSEFERHRLDESLGEGARLFLITVSFDLQTFDEQFRRLTDALSEHGDIVSTLPGIEESAPDRIAFRILYTTPDSLEQVALHTEDFGASVSLVAPPVESEAAATPETDVSSPDKAGDAEENFASAASITSLVRVPLDEIDELISATHELFTDTMQAIDRATRAGDETLRATVAGHASKSEAEIARARIRRRFVELEERLIEIRMIPVARTLERAVRAGEAAARVNGKEIQFEITGGEVRLDKSLADRVADPLLHLLRNAVDHGIERAEERACAGKDARGRVRLEAVSEGSRVRLRIADDGGGIDVERVRRASVERGLISEKDEVSEQRALRLIFSPGLSTAASVSSVSGRGVGLDVVEQTIESLGGELRVWSAAGAGTTFEMRLPTTLALVPSLVVRSAGHRYCIDAAHIVETGYARASDIERIGREARVTRWRGSVLPFVHLRELLAQPALETIDDERRLSIVVARIAGGERETNEGAISLERAAAVAVDEWSGHSEVLVRGLGSHATRWRSISGATEMRDGTIALMLDLPRLLEMHL